MTPPVEIANTNTNARFSISQEAIVMLGDILGQVLDYNEEDPTIDDEHVDEMVGLLEFLRY